MQPDAKEQIILRQYLLGELSEESRRQVEERLLTDTDSLEELEMMEEELIDQYLSSSLPAPEHEEFEAHFLATPERRRKLSFARAFNKYVATATDTEVTDALSSEVEVSDTKVSDALVSDNKVSKVEDSSHTPTAPRSLFPFFTHTRNPLLSSALAAGLILLLGIGVWLVVKNRRPGNSEANIVSVILTPGAVRGAGELTRITVPPETGSVSFQLGLQEEVYPAYRATVLTDEGREVITQTGLKAQATGSKRFISFTVPATDLPRGDYQVKLSGQTPAGEFEEIAGYTFRVIQ
jgi:hypothetical protein